MSKLTFGNYQWCKCKNSNVNLFSTLFYSVIFIIFHKISEDDNTPWSVLTYVTYVGILQSGTYSSEYWTVRVTRLLLCAYWAKSIKNENHKTWLRAVGDLCTPSFSHVVLLASAIDSWGEWERKAVGLSSGVGSAVMLWSPASTTACDMTQPWSLEATEAQLQRSVVAWVFPFVHGS